MNFSRLVNDSKFGLSRKISSRKEQIIISNEEFNLLSKKYFKNIHKDKNLLINFDENDKETLIFILRWYYNLWIDVRENYIEVYTSIPDTFKIVSEVNKLNHPHSPRTFEKGTKMYFNSSSYSSSNWLKGIPLWDNKDEEVGHGLKPSCQINYEFIKSINT